MNAFTFSGVASRFNEKRMLIAEEVNCIETAYLRLHLLSHSAQPALQQLFRRYIDSRIETYRRLPNMAATEMEMAESKKIQEDPGRGLEPGGSSHCAPGFSSFPWSVTASRDKQHD
jgi:hypothetical protein